MAKIGCLRRLAVMQNGDCNWGSRSLTKFYTKSTWLPKSLAHGLYLVCLFCLLRIGSKFQWYKKFFLFELHDATNTVHNFHG